MIFSEIPSLLPAPCELPADVQYERRQTAWMCHMRWTTQTEALAQSFPVEATVTLTENTHNFTCVFLRS